MKCPNCGYEDPFHPSWFDFTKEVAEPCYFEEWNPTLFELLKDLEICRKEGDVVYDGYVYHRTPTSIERMSLEISIQIGLHGRPPQEKAGRKNYHLLGRKLAKELQNT